MTCLVHLIVWRRQNYMSEYRGLTGATTAQASTILLLTCLTEGAEQTKTLFHPFHRPTISQLLQEV